MRTTITIDDAIAETAKRLTGTLKLSQAFTMLVQNEDRIRRQLAAIELLRRGPLPHDMKKIKAARRSRVWSA